MSRIKYLIAFIILTSCSNKDLLNNEERKYLLELTESKDFILSENNGSLRMEVYDSKIISKEEQKLFSSIIIKEVSSIVDKKRTTKNTNADNIVLFINNNKKDAYTIKNTTLSEANRCYKSIDSLINSVETNDREKTKRFIDNELLKENQVNELIVKWFNVFDLDKKYTINSYGFTKNKVNFNNEFFDVIELYLQYDENLKREFLKLSFKSGLLIDLTKE